MTSKALCFEPWHNPDIPDATGYSTAITQRFDRNQLHQTLEYLAEETPIALAYNGISHVVMMATPLDLEDFACGFSLTEGIVESVDELRDREIIPESTGITINLQLGGARLAALKERRRSMSGRTGCGLCGKEALQDVMRPLRQINTLTKLSTQTLASGFRRLEKEQAMNACTGSMHAAGLLMGEEILVREDVGRHNALDKVIGAAARQQQTGDALLISSRASYEMVLKAAHANIAILAAISAPTALAVRVADQSGITLIGFARDDRMTIYTHAHRISNP